MFKKLAIGAAFALALAPAASFAAGGGEQHVEDYQFSFEGPFGTYDQNQLQRGLQIYTEVCAACHGLKYVPLRTLSDEGGVGLTEDQVRAYAAENFTVYDPELDDDRPAIPTDHFPENTAAGAPDLSMMAKARAGFHGPGVREHFRRKIEPSAQPLLGGFDPLPRALRAEPRNAINDVSRAHWRGNYGEFARHSVPPGKLAKLPQELVRNRLLELPPGRGDYRLAVEVLDVMAIEMHERGGIVHQQSDRNGHPQDLSRA